MVKTKKQLLKVINLGFSVLQVIVAASILLLLVSNMLSYSNIITTYVVILVALLLFFAIARFKAVLITHINESFAPIVALEQWAENNNNSVSPITINTAIGASIAKLQQQLLTESYGNSSFDMLLREKALLDGETGIGTREFFNSRLEALLKEEDAHGAVLFLHFKELDTVQSLYGKQQALTLLATLIHTIEFRLTHLPSYFIARRNEFELALLIPDIYVKDTEKLATRLVNNLMAIPLPIGISNEEIVHVGISFFKCLAKSYQVMAEADMALRSAQLQGPSQWFMYDKDEVEQAKGSLKWRTLLTKVIARNAFVIFFQPMVEQGTKKILHHEVLAKMRDSEGQLISARMFMPMVRKCGFTEQVDLLIVEQVCKLLTFEHQQESCSLNLSIESLMSVDFIDKFKTILVNYPNVSSKIIIEISEYHLVNNLALLKPVLYILKDQGITILSDKVGQYVVSSQYLKECPISSLKLHRSIVLNIQHKPENQTVIQSLKAICTPLNINIYALGVENEDEWQVLKKLGVNGGQGHFFTKPVAQAVTAIH